MKFWQKAGAVLIGATIALTPVAAHATTDPYAQHYKTFVWAMVEGSTADDPFAGGTQTLLHVSDVTDTPDNTLFDSQLVQGSCEWTGYQVDVYRYSTADEIERVDALEGFGYLVEYGDPVKEPHAGTNGEFIKKVIYPAKGQATDPTGECFTGPEKPAPVMVSETRDQSPVCADPLDGSQMVTHEARQGEQDWVFTDGAWVPGDVTWGDWAVTGTDSVVSVSCLPEPTITTQWGEPTVTCDDAAGDVLTVAGTETTITPTVVDGAVVNVESVESLVRDYTVTDADVKGLDCAVTPPVEPTTPTEPTKPAEPVTPVAPVASPASEPAPAVTPIAAAPSAGLAVTGTPSMFLMGIAGGIVILAGAAFLAARAIRARKQ